MAEDIETTLQLRWASRCVDFENTLYSYINKKFVQNIVIQNWVYENIVHTKINQTVVYTNSSNVYTAIIIIILMYSIIHT